MTHTFAATPARSRTLPRASRAPHSKNPLTSNFSEQIQITLAMRFLEAGIDAAVIALWLGHESQATTSIYLHADIAIKRKALERTRQPDTRAGEYRPADPLLTWLKSL
jgi:integrase